MNNETFKKKFLYFARKHSRLRPPEVPSGQKPTVDELAQEAAFVELIERYVTKHDGRIDTQITYIAGAEIVDKKGISTTMKRYPDPYKLLEKEAKKNPEHYTNKTLILMWLLALEDFEIFVERELRVDKFLASSAKEKAPKDKRKIN